MISRPLFLGGSPDLHLGVDRDFWLPAYVATYLERDVRNVLRIANLPEFNRFFLACALRTAQVINYTDLARDTCIAPNTARKWVRLLETSGVVAKVEPYFGNRTMRLITAPEFVFLDTGLAAFLTGFRSVRELTESPLIGTLWESHIFGQLVRQAASRTETTPVGYWRTAGGKEVDVVIEWAGMLTAIECKWKEHPRDVDTKGLKAIEAAEPRKVKQKMIVYRTKTTYCVSDGTWGVNTADALKRLAAV